MNYFRVFTLLSLIVVNSAILASDFNTLKKQAVAGDVSSQYSLGLKYLTGKGVEENRKEGDKWIKLAAQNGDLGAQLFYGKRLPNYTEGLTWISKSAEKGNIRAQTFLGELYRTEKNHYVDVDIEKSVFWLEKAAQKTSLSSMDAPFRLFLMYENGDGVKQNAELASSWLKAVLKASGRNTDWFYESAKDWDSLRLNSNFIHIRLSAEMGNSEAQNILGRMYTYGYDAYHSPEIGRLSIKRDGEKALKWLKLASGHGNIDANYNIGGLFLHGVLKHDAKEGDWWSLKRNSREALKYYTWAAEEGHSKAIKVLKTLDSFVSSSWNKYDEAKSRYTNQYLENTWYAGSISFSKSGDKRLYFSIRERKDICKPSSAEFEESIWEFNKQAITMTVFCNKRDSSDNFYISATPTSQKGHQFVVNEFIKSPEDILIEGAGYSFKTSAIGFTEKWKSKSNKAL